MEWVPRLHGEEFTFYVFWHIEGFIVTQVLPYKIFLVVRNDKWFFFILILTVHLEHRHLHVPCRILGRDVLGLWRSTSWGCLNRILLRDEGELVRILYKYLRIICVTGVSCWSVYWALLRLNAFWRHLNESQRLVDFIDYMRVRYKYRSWLKVMILIVREVREVESSLWVRNLWTLLIRWHR